MKRNTAAMVVLYFGAAQLAILPAALQANADGDASTVSPYSLTALVDYLNGQTPTVLEHGLAATSAPDAAVGPDAAIASADLSSVSSQAVSEWAAAYPDADLSGLSFAVADLPGLELGEASGSSITIDVDAAGHGWDANGAGAMSLLTAVRHEVGHVLGLEHGDGLMASTLSPGVTHGVPAPAPTEPPADDTTPPADDAAPPADDTTPPADDAAPPADDTTPPADDAAPPADDTTPPADDAAPPADDTTPPADDTMPPAEPATGWVVDAGHATLTATGALAHTLSFDATANTLSLAGATDAVDVLDLAGVTGVTVLGSSGADVVTLSTSTVLPVAVTIDLGAGLDELVGPGVDTVWSLDGVDSGSVLGLRYLGVENVTGGVDNEDEFVVTATGRVSGIVEGGDGGFDIVTLAGGGFASFTSSVIAADEGLLARDGDVLHYDGMEPIAVNEGTAAEHIYNGTEHADIITIADHATSGSGWITIGTTNTGGEYVAETLDVELAGVTKITINGLAGGDSFVLTAVAADLSGVLLDLVGGDEMDTVDVSALNLPGLWNLTGINSGTWDGDAGVIEDSDDDLQVVFTETEFIVSGDAAETVAFDGGGVVVGGIDDGLGDLTVTVARFGSVTGDLTFTTDTYAGTDSAVSPAAVNATVLSVSAATGDAFFGLRAGGLEAGVTGEVTNWGIAILADGPDVWQVWAGSLTAPDLGGLAGVELDVDEFAIAINGASSTGRAAIDFSGAGNELVLGSKTIGFGGRTFAITATDASLRFLDFVWVTGELTFALGLDDTVVVNVADLDGTDLTNLQTAVSDEAARQADPAGEDLASEDQVAFDDVAGLLTNLPVSTVTVSLTAANAFVGHNPAGFGIFDAGVDYEAIGAVGIIALGLNLGLSMVMVRPDELAALLPTFVGFKGTATDFGLEGLGDILTAELDGIEVHYNSSSHVGDDTDSSATIDWAASFPSTSGLEIDVVGSGLPAPLTLDMTEATLLLKAERATLSIGDFVHVSGGVTFKSGGQSTATVGFAGLDDDTDFQAAAQAVADADGSDDIEWAGGRLSGVALDLTTFGIDSATVFAGYKPGGFDATGTVTCTSLAAEEAYGLCVDGIDVGVALASLHDPDLIAGYSLPDFTAVDVLIPGLDFAGGTLLGAETDLFDLSFDQLRFTANRGGAVKLGTAAIANSEAWVDFSTWNSGAGVEVPAGSTTHTIDVSGPTIGVSADQVVVRIDDFIRISGGFSFVSGDVVDVVVETVGLTADERGNLGGALTGASIDADGVITGLTARTNTLGIDDAQLFVGYSPDGFGTDGLANGGAFGIEVDGVDFGMVLAGILPGQVGTGYKLPGFTAMQAEIDDISFLGLPEEFIRIVTQDLSAWFNSGGAITGTAAGTAHVNWLATAQLEDSEAAGYSVPTGTTTEPVLIDATDPAFGVSAELISVAIGDLADGGLGPFLYISGSLSFQKGELTHVNVQTAGLSPTELSTLGTDLNGPALDGDVLKNLHVATTMLGIGQAHVFAGYNADAFDLTAPQTFDCAALPNAYGFCASGIELGMVWATATPGQFGTIAASTLPMPSFFALKASIDDLHPLGLDELELELRFEGVQVSVNREGTLGTGVAYIDWDASFPDPDGTGDGVAGLAVPTGTTDVMIDYDNVILGISAELITISISDFVHVSGSFAYTSGGYQHVNVDVETAASGIQTITDVLVTFTTIGIADASIFVGYNPNAEGTDGPSFDIEAGDDDKDGYLDRSDLDDDAIGVLLQNIDFGLVLAKAAPSDDQNAAAALQTFPTFMALRATMEDFELVNLLPDFINIQLERLSVFVNKGGNVTGTKTGKGAINWVDSFPDPAGDGTEPPGFNVDTGSTEGVNLDFEGSVIGFGAGLVVISISEFVHVSGGFEFSKGATMNVDIQTNDPLHFAASTLTRDDTPADGVLALSTDGSMLFNVDVSTIKLGINDASVYVGYADLAAGETFDVTAGGDVDGTLVDERTILDRTDIGDDAIGLLMSNVDFAMVLSTIVPDVRLGAVKLPRFTTIKAFVGEATFLGLEDVLTIALRGVRVEVNIGTKWLPASTAKVGAAIDWNSSFDGGFGVSTGDGNPDIVLDMDGYLIGGGFDLLVIGIGEFVHLRGSAYFEMGQTITVPLVDGPVPALTLASELGIDPSFFGEKQLRFMNIGAEDVYAFVGLGGPHWILADDDDLTSNVLFECEVGATCNANQCDDTVADGEDHPEDLAICVEQVREDAIGIGVSDLDFAMALGKPTDILDPFQYITMKADIAFAGLVGFEDLGITAELHGVSLEVNIATLSSGGTGAEFLVLPAIDWRGYADQTTDDSGCTADMIAGDEAYDDDCTPFGVKTGALDENDDDVTVDFFYDGLYIRAAVELIELDMFGILAMRGSMAFVLGPAASGLVDTDGAAIDDLTTMTIGGGDIYGFIGYGGPHWTEDEVSGELRYECADGATSCTAPDCAPGTNADDNTNCQLEVRDGAIGLAVTDLDFGLFVGLNVEAPAVYTAASLNVDSFGLIGVPGVTANGFLALALNLGFSLSGAAAINFKDSFRHDTDDDGIDDTDGLALDTGDPDNPVIIDFDAAFIEVQTAGQIDILDIVRLDGIFYFGLDIDQTDPELRILALAEMTIGPDIGATDPIFSIGALGVLILNNQGFAADFQVNLEIDVPLVTFDVDARIIINSTADDQDLVIPERLSSYLTLLGTGSLDVAAFPDGAVDAPVGLGPLAQVLLDRLHPCEPLSAVLCYTIKGAAPNLITGSGNSATANADAIDGLFGRNGKNESHVPYLGDAAYVVVLIDGKLNLAGFAEASVFGAVNIGGDAFQLIGDVKFVLGARESVGLVVQAKAIMEVTQYGILINASVGIQANLLQVFELDVAGSMSIDTRTRLYTNGGGTVVNPDSGTFSLILSGDVTVLKIISFNAQLVFLVGGDLGANQWAISGTASVDLAVLGVSGSFFISSWGSFSFGLGGYLNLTVAGTGVQGNVSAHVSYCLHQPSDNAACQDDVGTWVTGVGSNATLAAPGGSFGGKTSVAAWIASLGGTEESGLVDGGRKLWFSIGGSVKIKFLGFTLAGFRLAIQPSAPIALGGGATLVARGTIELLWWDINFSIPVGYISLPNFLRNAGPPPPHLAHVSGSQLVLNVGSRGGPGDAPGNRTESAGVCSEFYHVWYDSSTSEHVVEAFGREDRFDETITEVVGHFGDCDDSLVVADSVSARVTATGGDGDDVLISYGSGKADFSGGDGFDIIRGGIGHDVLDGGDGDDFIQGGWGSDLIKGGAGQDLIYGAYVPSVDGDPSDDIPAFTGYDNDVIYGTMAESAGEQVIGGLGDDVYEILFSASVAETIDLGHGTVVTPGATVNIVTDSTIDCDAEPSHADCYTFPDSVVTGTSITSSGYPSLTAYSAEVEKFLFRLAGGDTLNVSMGTLLTGDVRSFDVTSANGGGDRINYTTSGVAEVVTITAGTATAPATSGPGGASVPTGSVTFTQVYVEGNSSPLALRYFNTQVGGSHEDSLVVATGNGSDRIAVTAIEVKTTLEVGGSVDTVHVSSSASCTSTGCTLGDGTVDSIDAHLMVTGSGDDLLVIGDRADTSGDTNIVLTDAALSGAGLHSDGLGYSGLATLDLEFGDGGDKVHVKSTLPTTTIRTRGGPDTIHVASDAAIGLLDPVGHINDIDGRLVIEGGSDSDVLIISDRADGASNSGTLTLDQLTGFSPREIVYRDVETLDLKLGIESDDLTISSVHGGITRVHAGLGNDDVSLHSAVTGATVTINGEGGNDWIEVQASAATLHINGGSGLDHVELGSTASGNVRAISTNGQLDDISGAVTADGGGDAGDRLLIDETGDTTGETGTLTANSLTGLGLGDGVTYTDFTDLRIALGVDGTTFLVKSTNGPGDAPDGTTDTILLLGGGDDTVHVSSDAPTDSGSVNAVLGHITIDGEAGTNDRIFVSDRGDLAGNTGLLSATDLTGLGMGTVVGSAGVTYANVALLDIALGTGGDDFTVLSTHVGRTNIDARAGADTLNVRTIDGYTVITTGSGTDLVLVGSSAAASAGTIAGLGGDIDAIDALLHVDGEGDHDRLVVDDTGDALGDVGTLTLDRLSGFSPGDVTYAGQELLHLLLGLGADDLTIESVHGTTTQVDAGPGDDDVSLRSAVAGAIVEINGQDDDDWIEVQASAATLTISGNDDDDHIELGSVASSDVRTISTGGHLDDISGPVTVHGNDPSASDWLYLDDTGDLVGEDGILTSSTINGLGLGASGVTYTGIEHLQIALGVSGTALNVLSTNGPGDTPISITDTLLLLGDGDDTVNVSSDAPTNLGTLNAVLGHITIEGEDGVDTVNVSDRSDTLPNVGELTATDLTGLGMGDTAGINGITYGGLEYLNIDLGSGGDIFTVHSTHVGETTLDTFGGGDLVDVGGPALDLTGIDGFLDIDTGTGDDDLVVNGQSQTLEMLGRITSTEITGLATTIDPRNDAADAVHAVTIDGAGQGLVTLTINGATTSGFAFNSTADVVRGALVTALGVTSSDILVSRSPLLREDGIVFRITFVGTLASQAGHDLGALTIDATGLTALPSQTIVTRVVAMSNGRIEYTAVEELEVSLGSGVDHVALDSTGSITTINGGADSDVLDVETIDHVTVVNGQTGDDTLQVNVFPQVPDTNDIDALLTLNGAGDSDTFFIQLSSVDDSFIDVVDTGATGTDNLYVQGSEVVDQFLLRAELVALLNSIDDDGRYQHAEYVSYGGGIENLVVNTLDGNDKVAFDDTTVATTVNLGAGADMVQVGQLFGEECADDFLDFDPLAASHDFDCFDERFIPPALIDSTQGMLSNGISQSTTINGGIGNDLMIVFHNLAVLALNGEDGDDTFVIRTFLEEDSETQLDAGQGTDVVSYIMNAPVNVNGGSGYDRLYIVGTEADDVFVITKDGVYGGGRFISFVNIELLGLDTVEGNDYVHVQSTDPNVSVEVYGGLGSDTVEVGSNLVPTVLNDDGDLVYRPILTAADDLVGHSGLVVHNVESTTGAWTGLTLDGIAAEVVDDDEAAVVILQTGGTTLVAEGSTTDTYTVQLTRAPDTDVRIDVLAAILSPEAELALAYNVRLSLDGTSWSERGVALEWTTSNWFEVRTVHVQAYDDLAEELVSVSAVRHVVNGLIRGVVTGATASTMTDTGAFAGHDATGKTLVFTSGPAKDESYVVLSNTDDVLTVEGGFVTQPGAGDKYDLRDVGEYEGVVLNDLNVRIIDNDVREVVIVESGVDTTVSESGIADSYVVMLSQDPGGDTVAVDVVIPDGVCVALSVALLDDCAPLMIDLDGSSWTGVTVFVRGDHDGIVEGFQFETLHHTADGAPVGSVLVGIADMDAPGVLVAQSHGTTVVAEGIDLLDSYTLVLTMSPDAGEVVTVTADAISTKTQYDPDIYVSGDRVTYDQIQVELRYRRHLGGGWSAWSSWSTDQIITFDDTNWFRDVQVQVRAIDDTQIDGRILQAFAEAPARVNRIQGTLYVDGGISEFGYPLNGFVPVLLPGETSTPNFVTPNPAFDVIEANALDTLIVHNEDDVADSELTLTTTVASLNALSPELAAHLGLEPDPDAPTESERYWLDGLGMGSGGIHHLNLEVLDILLGSGSDDVTVLTTHTGTTTVRGHAGDDVFDVVEIKGHTRILGGRDDDTVTVTDEGLLSSIDAQLLISGEDGLDTVYVDDTADVEDDLGTLTQTSLVGLDMVSTRPNDMFSLELTGDVTAFELHVVAFRAADPLEDDPGIDLDVTFTVDDAAIAAIAAIEALPYGSYSTMADLDPFLLAGLIHQALFPYVSNAASDDYVELPDGTRQYTLPDGSTDDDRFSTTGCGKTGTTGERDSRCSMSAYVWSSDGRVLLIGFQGELAGIDIGFEAVPITGTSATDLLRTDGITYDTIETLDIRLGSGDDRFNVRGTLPHTLLDTGPGDDVVFVSDAADLEGLAAAMAAADRDLEVLHEAVLHGTVVYDDLTFHGSLDEVEGDLDVDTGTGSNTLAVSDHADGDADSGFAIDDHSIVGLADGAMTYTASGGDLAGQGKWTKLHDAGMFGRGITIHLGTGDDVGTVASVRGGVIGISPFGSTATTVYGNEGDDTITVNTPDVANALLIVHGDEGDDTIDGGDAGLSLDMFGDQGFDTLTGGSNADRIIGDDGRVYFLRPAGDAGFDVVLGGDPADIDLDNPHTGSTVGADADFDSVEVILTRDTHNGATGGSGVGDVIVGNAGNDIILAGAASDEVDGDSGNDLIFGDFAWIGANVGGSVDASQLPLSMAVASHPFTYTSAHITDPSGAGDIVSAGTGADIVLGQQGSDQLFGGDDDDDLIGGHDVAGGHDAGDVIDGGRGHDVVVGDNAQVLRTGAALTTRVRALSGTTLRDGVTGTSQLNPTGVEVRAITILDHAVGTSALLWGADTIAGGQDDDVIFGQLGDDVIHGDGSATTDGIAPAADDTTDGDDYVEGNGGADTIFGGLGQDDLIGGSSDLFGLTTIDMRPDAVDTIHGGNGDRAARNDLGLSGDEAHGRDADTLLGDNGRVFRIVGTNGTSSGAYLSFTYDSSGTSAAERVIPRVLQLLDYSPIGGASYVLGYPDPANPVLVTGTNTNIGGGDFLHGESGDDVIYGATGQDAIFGDAGDDDLFGGAGRDWISGGTGGDNIVSDHGWINTSRHGETEALYGILAATVEQTIDIPGNLQSSVINQSGTLHAAVELDLEIDGASYTTFYVGDHDVAYGGWGNDFIHGGEGDDMLSGAEALAVYFTTDPLATLRALYPYFDTDAGVLQHGVARFGEFRCYDEFAALVDPMICDEDAQASSTTRFLSGNDATENADGGLGDGEDVLFGDGGNDWMVGGTARDVMFGGWGDDLLDADDDRSTNGGQNDAPDAQTGPPSYADIAYGGAGRDVMIANTGADRLIDWIGEYNSYIVPFSPYGAATISRMNAPHLRQYLYDLSEAEGADVTRGGDVERNGEPYGELGLVTQKDEQWGDQSGAPDDPQAGNSKGKRDVLRNEDFGSATATNQAFFVDSGDWTVRNGRYESVAAEGQDAVSIFYVDAVLPTAYEILATVNTDKPGGGLKANAYVIYDYMSTTDFKFAGIDVGLNKVQIGTRTAAGWNILASANRALKANRDYDLRLWADGQVVELYVDGVLRLTHDYGSPMLDPEDPSTALDPLTDGMIAVGSDGAVSRITTMAVQTLAPPITFTLTDEFGVLPTHDVVTGAWHVDAGNLVGTPVAGGRALTTTTMTVAATALLVVDTVVRTDDVAGVAFDLYDVDRFKFAVLDTAAGQLRFGHVAAGVWTVERSVSVAISQGVDHALAVHLDGTTANVLLDGDGVGGHTWFSLLNDGDVGLLATGGAASFMHLSLATDDPDLEPAVPFVSVADASVTEGDAGTTEIVVTLTLSRLHDEDVTVSWSTSDGTATAGEDYTAASGTVVIAAGEQAGTLTIAVSGDTTMETDETVWLHLSGPTGSIIGDGTGLMTIVNDDVDVVLDLVASDADASESGNDAGTFTVTRAGSTAGALTVRLDWSGTAELGIDYAVTADGGTLSADRRTLTIGDGVSAATLTVTPITDTLAEATEQIVLTVLADEAYGVGQSVATVMLSDDTALPTLSISGADVVEGDRGGSWTYLTITLSEAAAGDVTVEVRSYEQTATVGDDFKAVLGTVTITAGATSATIGVRVFGDRTREGDETFTIELSNPNGAVLAVDVALVTIIDDDGPRATALTVGSGRDATPLSSAQLASVTAEARAWWLANGGDATVLDGITLRIVDLEGATLAVTDAGRVLVDVDAAGHGWSSDGAEVGRIDLLSVMLHELGHMLGHEHAARGAAGTLDAVMAPVFAPMALAVTKQAVAAVSSPRHGGVAVASTRAADGVGATTAATTATTLAATPATQHELAAIARLTLEQLGSMTEVPVVPKVPATLASLLVLMGVLVVLVGARRRPVAITGLTTGGQ